MQQLPIPNERAEPKHGQFKRKAFRVAIATAALLLLPYSLNANEKPALLEKQRAALVQGGNPAQQKAPKKEAPKPLFVAIPSYAPELKPRKKRAFGPDDRDGGPEPNGSSPPKGFIGVKPL